MSKYTPYIIVYTTEDMPKDIIVNSTVQPYDVSKFVEAIRGQGGRCWAGFKESYQMVKYSIQDYPDKWLR